MRSFVERRHPRVAVNLDVLVEEENRRVGRAVALRFVRARNVSLGGMLLETSEPLTQGAKVNLSFVAPNDERVFADAEVVWSNDRESGLRFDRVVGEEHILAMNEETTECETPMAMCPWM